MNKTQKYANTFGNTRRPRSMRDPASWKGESYRPNYGQSYRGAD